VKSDKAVVLLCDGDWPDVPGVRCWRRGVRATFGSLDATVREVVWRPPPSPVSKASSGPSSSRRLAWLPAPLRRPLARAYRQGRRVLGRSRSRGTTDVPRPVSAPTGPVPLAGTEGADLVLAESLRAARAAVAAGTPAYRVWALALPPQWLPPGGHTEYGVELNETAKRIGGFLTDSELARESIERCAHSLRPRVEIFPPIAADHSCGDHPAEPVDVASLDPTVRQLSTWHDLIQGEPDGAPLYSFPAARLRGMSAPWANTSRAAWQDVATTAPMTMPGADSANWSADVRAAGARAALAAVVPGPRATLATWANRASRKAIVAGHDLKFAVDLADRLDRRTDLDVVIDEWPGLSKQTAHTVERLEQADSILAEWARTSAIWLAGHKRPGQFLVVRLHRFELDTQYPRHLPIEKVDAVVYIAPLFGRRIRDEVGWPPEKLVYIPNFVDMESFDRPKLPGARFTLGFVGLEFIRKRFDLALDLLAAVRREDPRFRLAVRGVMPWNNKYAWANDDERDYAGWCFERIERDPLLRDSVAFHQPGRDMARWFRRVGYIVSASDEEGSHASVAEGMASGAVPVVRAWPGAAEIYAKQWVHTSIDGAASSVLVNADPTVWSENSQLARDEIRRTHDPAKVAAAWADLLHADLAGSRRYFEEYSSLDLPEPHL
jgi:glycosyltransferase involved in cell wall biosynthesis